MCTSLLGITRYHVFYVSSLLLDFMPLAVVFFRNVYTRFSELNLLPIYDYRTALLFVLNIGINVAKIRKYSRYMNQVNHYFGSLV